MRHWYSPQTELIGLQLSSEGDRTASGVIKSTKSNGEMEPINNQIQSIRVPNGRTSTVNDEATAHTRDPHTPGTPSRTFTTNWSPFPIYNKIIQANLIDHLKILFHFQVSSPSTFKSPKHPSSQTPTNNHIKVSHEMAKVSFQKIPNTKPPGPGPKKKRLPLTQRTHLHPQPITPQLPTLAVSFSPPTKYPLPIYYLYYKFNI